MANIKLNSWSKQFYLAIKLTFKVSTLKQLNHAHKKNSNTKQF